VNTLDLVILGVVALFLLLGLKKGFIISVATLIGLVAGLYAAIYFSTFAGRLIGKFFETNSFWLPYISFALTFIAVLTGVYLIGKMLEQVVDLSGLGILNHMAGALLGILKGVLLLSVFFYLIRSADTENRIISEKARKGSLFYDPVARVFPQMAEFTKSELFNKENR